MSEPSEIEPGRVLFAHALEQRLLDGLAVGPGDEVLELASGIGAMCLRLAERVRSGGSTICSDLRPDRVAATKRRVTEAGAQHIDVRMLDMACLDLPDASVDGVLCRWGFMFPVPPADAFAEALRVLRPGRRLALAVWADPRRNPWITLVDDALVGAALAVPADRTAPGRMFSLADPTRLRALLVGAGFEAVAVEGVPLAWGYADFDAYWEEEAVIPGPFEDYLRDLPPTDLSAVRHHLQSSIERFSLPDGGYRIPGLTLVATGLRPTG
jgi:SAM-dependent methyltransferase